MDMTEKKQPAIIALHDVSKSFYSDAESIVLFQGVTTTFVQGISYGLSGASGTGKSTFLNLLAGLDNPTSGAVLINGRDLAQYTEEQKSQYLHEYIGFMFQYPYLIAELNVIENVMIKGLIDNEPDIERGRSLLTAVGLSHKEQAAPNLLSGGEQQRIALARALYRKPKFLIADEPTAHLDEHNTQTILSLVHKAQQEWGIGIIIASHEKSITDQMNHALHIQGQRLITN